MADKGFQKSEGMNAPGQVEHEDGTTGPEDHGWAPDAGPTSEPNRKAGEKSFEKHDSAPQSTSERKEPPESLDS